MYGVFLLALLAALLSLGKSNDVLLRGIDSNIHASAAMRVTEQGFLPRLPIRLDSQTVFNDHPFFGFWVNGWIMRALGPSAFSARLLTGLFAIGSTLLVFALGSTWGSYALGLTAAFFFVAARDMVLTHGTMSLDPAMLFFILLSFVLWFKHHRLLAGLAAGVGLWWKTPLVLLLYPVLATELLLWGGTRAQKLKSLRAWALSLGVALAVGSLVWIVTGVLGGWDVVRDYWSRQVWGTAVEGRSLGFGFEPLAFWRLIRLGFLPGLPFLFWGIYEIVERKAWRKPGPRLTLLALAWVVVPVTLMKFRLGHYFNPAFPFMALLAAAPLERWIDRREPRVIRGFGYTLGLLLTVLVVAPIPLAPEAFPALKRFMPLIQSYGDCGDRILLVPGGEPIGSSHDYSLVLRTYTERPVDVVACENVHSALTTHPWVLVSEENYRLCVGKVDRERFPLALQYQNWVLLGSKVPRSDRVDLTALERELKPVRDCQPAPYPQDLYHRYGTSGS